MSYVDVLNLEWSSAPSRDRIVSTLISNYLRVQGYNVMERSVFEGFKLLKTHKPKLFFINGAIGAKLNFDLVKYAKSIGCKVVSLSAEGNFTDDKSIGIGPYFWGWNKEKVLAEDYNLVWSSRVKEMIVSEFPDLTSRLLVSGGVGFDQYKINTKIDRNAFLKRYNKGQFNYFVGLGCWDFGTMFEEDYRHKEIAKMFNTSEIERFKGDRILFREIILRIIENNPDVMFIIKEHPGRQLGYKSSAIEGIEKYNNTIVIKREEPVDRCILMSDLWLVYESTTALEAWLYEKNTYKINPSGPDFKRNKLHYGSELLMKAQDVQNIIDSYKSKNKPAFELSPLRKSLIERIIGWEDGLNHVRAGNVMIDLMENGPKINKSRTDLKSQFAALKHGLANWRYSSDNFDIGQVKEYANMQTTLQLDYYNRKNLSLKELLKINATL